MDFRPNRPTAPRPQTLCGTSEYASIVSHCKALHLLASVAVLVLLMLLARECVCECACFGLGGNPVGRLLS